MLSFLTYKDATEQLEIIVDNKGIDDLIKYLKFIKEKNDHIHLLIDTELDNYSIPKGRENIVSCAKKVTIYFEDRGKND
jgi:hypothetical protein